MWLLWINSGGNIVEKTIMRMPSKPCKWMTGNRRTLRVGKKRGRAHKSPDQISHVLSFCEAELLLFQTVPVKSLQQNTKYPPHGNFVISEWNIAFISPIWLNNLQHTSSIKCSFFPSFFLKSFSLWSPEIFHTRKVYLKSLSIYLSIHPSTYHQWNVFPRSFYELPGMCPVLIMKPTGRQGDIISEEEVVNVEKCGWEES